MRGRERSYGLHASVAGPDSRGGTTWVWCSSPAVRTGGRPKAAQVPGFQAVPEGRCRRSCFLTSGTPIAILDSFVLVQGKRVPMAALAAHHYQALGIIVPPADIARSGAVIGRSAAWLTGAASAHLSRE
jgi:hypothetical protein